MAKKNNYYVLVFTQNGPIYVTHEGERHVAYWSKDRAPKELGKSYAEDMAIGLNWNGHLAVVVCMPFEITTQPYRYDAGGFAWKENDKAQEATE